MMSYQNRLDLWIEVNTTVDTRVPMGGVAIREYHHESGVLTKEQCSAIFFEGVWVPMWVAHISGYLGIALEVDMKNGYVDLIERGQVIGHIHKTDKVTVNRLDGLIHTFMYEERLVGTDRITHCMWAGQACEVPLTRELLGVCAIKWRGVAIIDIKRYVGYVMVNGTIAIPLRFASREELEKGGPSEYTTLGHLMDAVAGSQD